MWDPDYTTYLLNFMEEHQIEMPPPSYEEEEESEDDDDYQVPDDSAGEEDHAASTSDFTNVNDVALEGSRERSSPGTDSKEDKSGEKLSVKDVYGKDEINEGASHRGEIDGLFCPICFEAWSSGGDHHICCLPCGHIYGLSCIKKWLRIRGSGKCPQCKKKCGIKDIRFLYATQVVAIDRELEKKVKDLETKCATIQKKNKDLRKKEAEWNKREANICEQVQYLEKRTRYLEDQIKDMENRALVSPVTNWSCQDPHFNAKLCLRGRTSKFIFQKDFQVDGARLFDINSASKMFVIARRLSGFCGAYVLTKLSYFHNHEKEDIQLPKDMKAVKDLRVSPNSNLVLLASLGKKLSVISTESNNTILTYDLPTSAWSCSWDVCNSHYVYAGLQNGTVLQFDMRHSMQYVEYLTGSSVNPIHSLHSLSHDSSINSGVRSVLTASSVGLCHWNFGTDEKKPYLIPESEMRGVCISLAYCPATDDIVASFRPKIEVIQTTPVFAAGMQGVKGSHIQFKKKGFTYKKLGTSLANVSDIRLTKSAIVYGLSENSMFASGDEETCELVVQHLPSFTALEHVKLRKHPIRDVKYTWDSNSGLLSCLSDDWLQLSTTKPF